MAAKKGYYTLYRTCTVYYRTEDQAFEPETLKEAKQNANDADLSDLEVNWVDGDWQVEEFEKEEE